MRLLSVLCVLALLSGTTLSLRAQSNDDSAAISGILVSASSAAGPTDERLKPYEPTLRRILRFESFQFLGQGRTTLPIPARGNLVLGHGHRLELQTEPSGDDRYRVQVSWVERGRPLMRTELILRAGVPAVIGGPSRGDGEVYAVIVIAQ